MGGCFYQPFRNPQGGSCMAGYLCPMPTGIIFMLTAPIFNFSSLIFHLDAAGTIHTATLLLPQQIKLLFWAQGVAGLLGIRFGEGEGGMGADVGYAGTDHHLIAACLCQRHRLEDLINVVCTQLRLCIHWRHTECGSNSECGNLLFHHQLFFMLFFCRQMVFIPQR